MVHVLAFESHRYRHPTHIPKGPALEHFRVVRLGHIASISAADCPTLASVAAQSASRQD